MVEEEEEQGSSAEKEVGGDKEGTGGLVPDLEDVEGQVVRVSLSHDTDFAIAVALWAGE